MKPTATADYFWKVFFDNYAILKFAPLIASGSNPGSWSTDYKVFEANHKKAGIIIGLWINWESANCILLVLCRKIKRFQSVCCLATQKLNERRTTEECAKKTRGCFSWNEHFKKFKDSMSWIDRRDLEKANFMTNDVMFKINIKVKIMIKPEKFLERKKPTVSMNLWLHESWQLLWKRFLSPRRLSHKNPKQEFEINADYRRWWNSKCRFDSRNKAVFQFQFGKILQGYITHKHEFLMITQ